MHVKLRTGMFELATTQSQAGNEGSQPQDAPKMLERPCRIVYPGKFMSMDGEVDVTEAMLEKLAANHNSVVNSLKRMAEVAGLQTNASPPIQVDHSRSGWDTVGRLVGPVELKPHQLPDGQQVKALFGTARILGKENVERVMDGRWSNLSIGADFEAGTLSELTITPFPAAEQASLLSKSRLAAITAADVKQMHKAWEAGEETPLEASAFLDLAKGEYLKTNDPELKKAINALASRLGIRKLSESAHVQPDPPSTKGDPMKVGFSSYLTEECKMSEEDSKKSIEKMRKRLMDKDKLSEADADKKLAEIPHEDAKRMMDECSADEAKEAKLSKLTQAKTRLTELKGTMTKGAESIRLAQRKLSIQTRLSKLRSEAKITPAEIKKLDIAKLAAGTEEAIAAALDTFSAREPQVMAGLVGNANATSVARMSEDRKKAIRMAKLEVEARKNMNKPVSDELKKLAEGAPADGGKDVSIHVDATPHTEYFEAGEWEEMKALASSGKDAEAKAVFARVLTRHMTKMADPAGSEEVPAAMGAAAEEMKQLQAQVEEAVTLASVLAEGTA